MNRKIKKYNPGFLTDQELVDSFCVRLGEFALLVEALRESTGNSNPHAIVIGPRGSGKTTLLLRVAAEVRRDAALREAWFPVVFPEEIYEVSTCGEFWLECLLQLADQASQVETDTDLKRTYEELQTVADDRILADFCLAAILDFADSLGKRLVLFVENLNTLFDDIGDPGVGWQLRKTLQCEPRILLMGSATSRFEEIENSERALYELFQVHTLKRLDTESCAVLWRSVSDRDADTQAIRSLEILTGGSPRLVAIVAEFGSRLSFHQLMDNLLSLVDDHTEYFRSHLEALGVQDRRVYLALARLWKPATARQVSARSRLRTSHCSAILRRLVDRGAVIHAGGTPRRKEYYLAERMYNIYYLLRRGRGMNRVVQALVHFMTAFYSHSELVGIRERIAAETRAAEGKLLAAMKQALQLLTDKTSRKGGMAGLGMTLGAGGATSSAKARVTKALEATGTSKMTADPRESRAGNLVAKAAQLLKDGQYDRAIAVCEKVQVLLVDLDTPNSSRLMANALSAKSVALARSGRPEDALGVCDAALNRYEALNGPEISTTIAEILANKVAVLAQLGRDTKIVSVSEAFSDRFERGDSEATDKQRSQVLYNKGVALAELNRPREAVAVFEQVFERFGSSDADEVQEPVARALLAKAKVLEEGGRTEDACAGYDAVVARFGSRPVPEVAEPVATAILHKGGAMAESGRFQDALACFEDLLKCFESDGTPPDIANHLAAASTNRGVMLECLNRPREALDAYESVIRRFSSHDSPEMDELLAPAYANRGTSLVRADRLEEGYAAIEDFSDRFSGSTSAPILEMVGNTLLEKAKAELRTGQSEAAISTAGRVLREFSSRTTDSLVLAHLLRAEGYFACQNELGCESELAAMLELMPRFEVLPSMSIEGLLAFTVRFGPKRVLALVEESPAVNCLFPLVTALRQESGLETKVAREVGEVAKDIRLSLARLRELGSP